MGEEHDTFWRLERANRRRAVELVVIFLLVYRVVGIALDLFFHTFRLVNHHLLGFPVLAVAALAIASVQALRAYFRSSSVLLGAVGAHDLASESAKTQAVADVVNEMALAARIPAPRLCMIEDPAPNASAAGRDPAHSVICATRGVIDQLDREEMQGVIAHEMAHIRGRDTRITQMEAPLFIVDPFECEARAGASTSTRSRGSSRSRTRASSSATPRWPNTWRRAQSWAHGRPR